MRTSRRKFLEMSSALGLVVPSGVLGVADLASDSEVTSGSAVQNASGDSPTALFSSPYSDLKDWTQRGRGRWTVNQHEVVANGEGWLLFNECLEDFVFKFLFQCGAGDVGIILRNAPTVWSRFSHPNPPSGNSSGIYVELTGPRAGAITVVTLDPDGRELSKTDVPSPPTDIDSKSVSGACFPVACVGINDPQGTRNGYPPEPPVRLSKAVDGWISVEVRLRGPALSWDKRSSAKLEAKRSQFGQLGLHVRGSDSTARFKELSIIDLTERVAGIAANRGNRRFHHLTDLFYSEGVAAADLNRDGHEEVIAGPFYYVGPEFRIAREIFPPTTVNPAGSYEEGNYSNTFLVHTYDFDGEGWPDIVMIMGFGPMPSFGAYLFKNPRGERRHWDNYLIIPSIAAETTILADVDGDGRPELIMSQDDRIGYAKYDPSDPSKPWKFIPVSDKGAWGPHGFGVGDVNADGRMDILQASGWWEQPEPGRSALWAFHPVTFGAPEAEWYLRGGADMIVYDVNGDGIPDVICSLNAHGPGLAWFEQKRDTKGNSTWERHLIMGDPETPMAGRRDWEETDKSVAFTELHALALADFDHDGSPSIVTGKRWWSHGFIYGENQIDNPPVLYRFKLHRERSGSISWIPRLIHNASGIGTQILAKDINQDGKLEVVTTARKGTFILFDRDSKE